MITSDDIVFFLLVAESQTLAEAARKLGVTPPNVTQRLNSLEHKLQMTLVERVNRRTELTSQGKMLVQQGKEIVDSLEELHNGLLENIERIQGNLRVVCPLGFGVKHLTSIVTDFQSLYPNLHIELYLSDKPSMDYGGKPDVLIYIGELADSSLTKVHLSKNRRLLLASPDYVAEFPTLAEPKDLDAHRCIALRENNEDVTMWRFVGRDSSEISVRIKPHLSSNVGEVVKTWALAGHGIIIRSEWDVMEQVRRGELLELMTDYSLQSADIVALVSKPRNLRSKKLNLFLDFLKSHIPKTW